MKTENNFDAIRLLASFMVVFAHSFPLLGYSYNYEPLFSVYKTNDFGHLGVSIFLFISGFLISKSIENSNSFHSFILKRLIRMLPALILLVLFTVIVIGPVFTTLPIDVYFKNRNTISYFKNILMYNPQYNLPNVFLTCYKTGIVNGSLWTLCYEFTFYIVLYFLLIFMRRTTFKPIACLIIYLGLFFVFNYYSVDIKKNLYTVPFLNLSIENGIDLFLYFFSGVLFFSLKIQQKIIVPLICIGVFCLFLFPLKSKFIDENIFYLIVPLLTYGIAFFSKIKLSFLTPNGDFSYGIYLYSFVIQQSIVTLFPVIHNPYMFFLISAIISYLFGYVSWHLIEKKVLKFKPV